MREVLILMLLLVIVGCQTKGEINMKSDHLEKFVLRDVQGLHGGSSFYLKEGIAIVQIVKRGEINQGLQEKRYSLDISPKEIQKLERLISQHRFFEIEIPQRLGVPDEARPTITVTLASGESKTVSKWFNDRHPDFDVIYGHILDLTKKVKDISPTYKGPYDFGWVPEGF